MIHLGFRVQKSVKNLLVKSVVKLRKVMEATFIDEVAVPAFPTIPAPEW